MVGDQETLEAGHVVVLGVPGDEDGGGGDVADVKGGDGGERAELFILRRQQETVGQRFWLGALRTHLCNGKNSLFCFFLSSPTHLGRLFGGVEPAAILSEPKLLVVRTA